MQVVIAEKPSVAQSIAAVIGATGKADGYTTGNGYCVTWCYGHLIEMLMPDAYGEKYKKWSIDTLPIIPEEWKYGVKKDVNTQFKVIRDLLNRSDVTDIVCATDAGREGELIFRHVYDKCGCRKPIKRLWISSMEDKAIKEGFEKLRDGNDFDNLYKAAIARERSDWIVGMNLSRLFTLIYGGGNKLSVGRVMTPTLALICERDDKIEHFVKEKYYVVHISDGSGIDAVSKSYKDRLEAVTLCDRLQGDTARVVSRLQEPKEKAAPLLYDLTSLQRDCNRMFGLSANKTLDIAQELYEKKLTTYPRTDAKYLTSDMGGKVPEIYSFACGQLGFSGEPQNIMRLINDKKVSDHHAIIPTGNSTNVKDLSEDSLTVYRLICLRTVEAFSCPYKYLSITLKVECDREEFTMKGQQITYRGYRLYEDLFKEKYGNSKSDKADKEKNEEEKAVPDVQAPYSFTAAMSMEEKETKPLSHFTEDTLLDVMDKAGSKEMSDEVERKGLGTSATRAGVIEKLIACKYIKRDKKKLLATDEGKYLISVVPEKIKSVSLTCDWENELLDVSAGKMEYDMFMKETKSFISTIIDENKNINAVERRNNKEVICVCPVCGNSITDGKYGAYCNGKCGISFSVIDGRRLTPSQIKSLIGDRKEVLLKDLKSSKCGTYDVYVKYAGTEKYSFTKSDGNEKSGYNLKLTLRFPEKKKKG